MKSSHPSLLCAPPALSSGLGTVFVRLSLEGLNQGAVRVLSFHKESQYGQSWRGQELSDVPRDPGSSPYTISSVWQSLTWLLPGYRMGIPPQVSHWSSRKRKKEATVEKDVQAFLGILSKLCLHVLVG